MFDMIKANKFVVYHAINEEFCSWHEFTKLIFEAVGITNVKKILLLQKNINQW